MDHTYFLDCRVLELVHEASSYDKAIDESTVAVPLRRNDRLHHVNALIVIFKNCSDFMNLLSEESRTTEEGSFEEKHKRPSHALVFGLFNKCSQYP